MQKSERSSNRSQPEAGDLERCECTPFCGKLLSERQRREHARIARELAFRRLGAQQTNEQQESQDFSQSTESNNGSYLVLVAM